MKCNHCGREIPDTASFCPLCGSMIIKGTFGGQVGQNQPMQQQQQQQWPAQSNMLGRQQSPGTVPLGQRRANVGQRQSGGVPSWVFVALAVVIAAGVAAAVYLLVAKDSTKSSEALAFEGEPAEEEMVEVVELPDYTDMVCYRWLSEADLYGIPSSELRLMRNTIFARKGYIFKSKDLTDYFNQYPWYYPTRSYIPQSDFSEIENHNIQLIKKFEK